MDFHLKQRRDHHKQQQQQDQEESDEQQPSPAKIPRLFHHLQLDNDNNNNNQDPHAIPLFAPTKNSAYTDSKPPLSPTSSTRGHFSLSQWQELELQALIFRHMAAGSVVPPELLQIVKKSLLSSPSYYLNNYAYCQPSFLQAAGGYWGRSAMDPEPGRCRRTDGKKWRCSREVVAGQKYCERHVHRGRNRSRKPVEFPATGAAAAAGSGIGNHKSSFSSSVYGSSLQQQKQSGGSGTHFSLSAPTPPLDIFHLNQGASEQKGDSKFPFGQQSEDGKYNGKVLRRLFDDWPANELSSPATNLSISTPATNSSLDFLKLSTGNGEDDDVSRMSSGAGSNLWGGESQAATMGGPLAEALRSSTGSSPTSVLNQALRPPSDSGYVT